MKLLNKIFATALLGSLLATSAQATTIAQAKGMYDDSRVTIKGKIVRALGNEKYELQDSTGKLRVDIDDEIALPNQLVGKTVTVTGDVDVKRGGRVDVDAEWVTIH